MTSDAEHPYTGLLPERVLDAVDRLGFQTDGRLLALNSYENRVYQVGIDEQPPLIVKFYRPQRWSQAALLEEHAFVASLAEHELPVVSALAPQADQTLYSDGEFWYALFPRRGGRAPTFDEPRVLEWMGRFLGRIHAIGELSQFKHRPTLNIETFGIEPGDFLLQQELISADMLLPWQAAYTQALEQIRYCYERAGAVRNIRLHGDCHAGNVLWTEAGPHFVDFDDSRSGPAIQDLWMLLSGSAAEQAIQMEHVLRGYEDFRDFDRRELHLIEALRTLRLIHYSAWIARRWNDPAFPAAFPWFGTPRYWQDRVLELREQIALMSEGGYQQFG
jgi:Ser/Thr protein kinase RdoA (MazF antagonist)